MLVKFGPEKSILLIIYIQIPLSFGKINLADFIKKFNSQEFGST